MRSNSRGKFLIIINNRKEKKLRDTNQILEKRTIQIKKSLNRKRNLEKEFK